MPEEHADAFRLGSTAMESNRPDPTSRQPVPHLEERLPVALPGSLELGLQRPATTSDPPQTILSSSSAGISEPSFPTLSPAAADRVFPVRSVVSVDPHPSPRNPTDLFGEGFSGIGSSTGYAYNERKFRSQPISQASSVSSRRPSVSKNASASSADPCAAPEKKSEECEAKIVPSRSHSQGHSASKSAAERGRSAGRFIKASQIFSTTGDDSSTGSENTSGSSTTTGNDNGNTAAGPSNSAGSSGSPSLITARFKHVLTADGHAVVTGRDGDTLQRCEDEPIHIPGAVQAFGALVALREESEDKLVVCIASENCKQILGYTPRQLFAFDSFCDILSSEQADNLLDHLAFVRDDEDNDLTATGPEVFTISIRTGRRRSNKLWCALHINPASPDLIICEFEIEDDPFCPLVPVDEGAPELPEDTVHSNPTADELADSTINISRPLRVLRGARRKKGDAAAMEVFNIMSQVQEQLANAENLDIFLKVLVGVVKELTGFHRVMIYQFDHAWNGKVVTELVDPTATVDLYKGLHFPASDIPKQARDLYKINKVRLLYDRDQETARLVCRTVEDLERPLDMTHCYLRAMSPIHLKYLANMAVRSSMSISLNAFNELWGLISCHSYGSKGMRVSFPIRKMCRLVGDTASRNIERLSYASRLQARKLINTIPTERNPAGYIIATSEDLLNLFDADCGLLAIRDETKILGKIQNSQEALAMLEYLRMRKYTSVLSSHDIAADFPDLRYTPGFHVIAGLLLVPLSTTGEDFIVFFRKGQIREVRWAGNPYEKFIKEGTDGYLEPRKSFRLWTEMIQGKSKDWTEEQIETAAALCLVYGKFIEVWRQKEAVLKNSKLTRLLLANSAHEVRTPLNAIINYLEIAMEGTLDMETRENLAKSHSASKSLIYVINDLLDLTKAEKGLHLVKDEIFDLHQAIEEATEPYRGDAKRKSIDFEVIEYPGIPHFVIGDQRRVRQTISNITANAIQHTAKGGVKVEVWLAQQEDGRADIEIAIQDSGSGMSQQKLDSLFQDLEQVTSEDDGSLGDASMLDQQQVGSLPGNDKRTLGLGLAIVARYIRNTNGQLRLKSEVGKGSRFVINLPFDLPDNSELLRTASATGHRYPPVEVPPTTPPAAPEGEVLLVCKSVTVSPRTDTSRKHSDDGVESLGSQRGGKSVKRSSSVKSLKSAKVRGDFLIGAIQGDPFVDDNDRNLRPPLSNLVGRTDIENQSPTSILPAETSGPIHTTRLDQSALPGGSSTTHASQGHADVIDSRSPLKAIKALDEASSGAHPDVNTASEGTSYSLPIVPADQRLHVLVAEDDPINSRIIRKRLEVMGHHVQLTVNGEECATAYGDDQGASDVIFMDMQMPIVDGLTSTKMIRSFEKTHSTQRLSPRAARHGRIPIFAVSASLVEDGYQSYIDAGFDGWILKPIDFRRVQLVFEGISNDDKRNEALYKKGQWENGGWFQPRSQVDVEKVDTKPSGRQPWCGSLRPSGDPVPDEPQQEDAPGGRVIPGRSKLATSHLSKSL